MVQAKRKSVRKSARQPARKSRSKAKSKAKPKSVTVAALKRAVESRDTEALAARDGQSALSAKLRSASIVGLELCQEPRRTARARNKAVVRSIVRRIPKNLLFNL